MKHCLEAGKLLSLLGALFLCLIPGCDDPGLHEALPQIDSFAVGDSDSLPSLDTFGPIPASSEVLIDFGQVDVGSINQRYLFVPNAGLGILNLTQVSSSAATNPDFQLACAESGGFVDDCPNPLAIDPGASLIIEVSWLLHHGSDDDDVQTWLYGTKAGAHWPKCEIYETNNVLKQHYDRTLKITGEKLRPHHQEIVDFAQAIVNGAPSPLPPEQSLQVQQILEALYKSQETGREVEIPAA